MTMTKKDYELIADVIQGCHAGGTIGDLERDALAKVFAVKLAIQGKRGKQFKRDKFLAQCGVRDVKTLLENGEHDKLTTEDYIPKD